jgi:DNA-binding transcriptional regulator GbsR (MarR family)
MNSHSFDNLLEPAPPTADLSQFIENMGLHFEKYGLPRTGGRILGLLLISSQPISSEEMADALQVARSSISTNLKTLLLAGLVEKISLPGERIDYYIFAATGWQRALEMRLDGILDLKNLGEQGLSRLPEGSPAFQQMEDMVAWANMLTKSIEKITYDWRAYRSLRD